MKKKVGINGGPLLDSNEEEDEFGKPSVANWWLIDGQWWVGIAGVPHRSAMVDPNSSCPGNLQQINFPLSKNGNQDVYCLTCEQKLPASTAYLKVLLHIQ